MENTRVTDIIGYASDIDVIARMCVSDHAPSGILITGLPYTGKSTIALEVARRIVGAHGASSHADIITFDPEPAFNKPDDELEWKKNLVRTHFASWIRRTRMKPASSPYIAAAVISVDRLSEDACQLLLKAIEDGPGTTRFLLTASLSEYVPATVRSRVVTVRLKPIPLSTLVTAMKARGISNEDANECAILSGGRPGLALQIASNKELRDRYRMWLQTIDNISSMRAGQKSAFAASCEDAEEFLRLLQAVTRQGILSGTAHSGAVRTVRRAREAASMIRAHVSSQLALEYVLMKSS